MPTYSTSSRARRGTASRSSRSAPASTSSCSPTSCAGSTASRGSSSPTGRSRTTATRSASTARRRASVRRSPTSACRGASKSLPKRERFVKAVKAGVDQFGGTEDARRARRRPCAPVSSPRRGSTSRCGGSWRRSSSSACSRIRTWTPTRAARSVGSDAFRAAATGCAASLARAAGEQGRDPSAQGDGEERRAARLSHRHRLVGGARAPAGRSRPIPRRPTSRSSRLDGAVRDAASAVRVRRDAARGRPRLPRGRPGVRRARTRERASCRRSSRCISTGRRSSRRCATARARSSATSA